MLKLTSNSSLHLFSRTAYAAENNLAGAIASIIVPNRNTYILKRRYPVALVKKGEEKYYRKLKAKNHIYDLVENSTTIKQRNIKVVLKTYIEGIGQKGEVIEVKRNFGYNKLLLPGLADYPTEEDIKNASEIDKNQDNQLFSSRTAPLVSKFLEKMVLSIVMNKETSWTLEPWHVKVAFRKAGVFVPVEAIKIPSQPITGPDLNLENKDFIVSISINKREEAQVRCRIHHWSTNIHDRLPRVSLPWCEENEPLFEEHSAALQQLPIAPQLVKLAKSKLTS